MIINWQFETVSFEVWCFQIGSVQQLRSLIWSISGNFFPSCFLENEKIRQINFFYLKWTLFWGNCLRVWSFVLQLLKPERKISVRVKSSFTTKVDKLILTLLTHKSPKHTTVSTEIVHFQFRAGHFRYFWNISIIKNDSLHFYQFNLTGSGLFKWTWCRNRSLTW